MKIKISSLLSILLIFCVFACSTTKNHRNIIPPVTLSDYEFHLVDSILQFGLDNEALYTLLGGIKPMSSLVTFSFPIANTDSAAKVSGNVLTRRAHGKYLDRLRTIQSAVNKIELPDLKIIMVPYLSAQGDRRIIQLSVVRESLIDSLLLAKENFFGQFGLVPGVDPVVVVTAMEGNEPLARWRGYGYLFGYPDYAVDFYNQAAWTHEITGEFVERNFFRIPTYSSSEYGNFVYAYPKNHQPTVDIDSALYNRSVKLLENYKNIRPNYLNADSSLQSYKLLLDYYGKN